MDMKKKEYTKPSIRMVEWEFSEAVCQTVTTTSYTKCLNVTHGKLTNSVEIRNTTDNSWNRVGPNSQWGGSR